MVILQSGVLGIVTMGTINYSISEINISLFL